MEEQTIESLNNLNDIPRIIKDYSSIAASYIEQQDFENALESLYHCREMLTSLEEQGGTIESSF